jgi:hypothetical protein
MSKPDLSPVTHDEAHAALQRFVDGHFGNKTHGRVVGPRFSIPARMDYDDDLVLHRYIEQQKVPAAEPQGGWQRISEGNLPDSDVSVALCDFFGAEWNSVHCGVLDFTDDSEGHGKPFWILSDGEEYSLGAFTHYSVVGRPDEPPPSASGEERKL